MENGELKMRENHKLNFIRKDTMDSRRRTQRGDSIT